MSWMMAASIYIRMGVVFLLLGGYKHMPLHARNICSGKSPVVLNLDGNRVKRHLQFGGFQTRSGSQSKVKVGDGKKRVPWISAAIFRLMRGQ